MAIEASIATGVNPKDPEQLRRVIIALAQQINQQLADIEARLKAIEDELAEGP